MRAEQAGRQVGNGRAARHDGKVGRQIGMMAEWARAE
jgi:hypothetical protein